MLKVLNQQALSMNWLGAGQQQQRWLESGSGWMEHVWAALLCLFRLCFITVVSACGVLVSEGSEGEGEWVSATVHGLG